MILVFLLLSSSIRARAFAAAHLRCAWSTTTAWLASSKSFVARTYFVYNTICKSLCYFVQELFSGRFALPCNPIPVHSIKCRPEILPCVP